MARAAAAGQGGRGREEDRQRRHLGVRGHAGAVRPGRRSPGTTRWRARRRSPACWSAARRSRPPAPGTEVDVVLDRTPFYAEGGGQLADAGHDHRSGGGAGDGARVEVIDVQAPVPGLDRAPGQGHQRRARRRRAGVRWRSTSSAGGRSPARTPRPTWCTGRSAARSASPPRRPARRTRRAGSGSTSPPPARCRGRCCGTPRTRSTRSSSTTWTCAPSTPRSTRRGRWARSRCSARSTASEVRVVEVGDYSRELCGGTHVARSGQLGLVKILGESSIGSGVRRVEALVGMDAFRFLASESVLVSQLTEQLKARREELPERIAGLVTRLRDAERDLERLRSAQLLGAGARAGRAAPEDIGGAAFVAHRVPDGTAADGDPEARARPPRPAARASGPAWWWWPVSRPTGRRWSSPSTTRGRERGPARRGAGAAPRRAPRRPRRRPGRRRPGRRRAARRPRREAAIDEAFDAVRAVVGRHGGSGGVA